MATVSQKRTPEDQAGFSGLWLLFQSRMWGCWWTQHSQRRELPRNDIDVSRLGLYQSNRNEEISRLLWTDLYFPTVESLFHLSSRSMDWSLWQQIQFFLEQAGSSLQQFLGTRWGAFYPSKLHSHRALESTSRWFGIKVGIKGPRALQMAKRSSRKEPEGCLHFPRLNC